MTLLNLPTVELGYVGDLGSRNPKFQRQNGIPFPVRPASSQLTNLGKGQFSLSPSLIQYQTVPEIALRSTPPKILNSVVCPATIVMTSMASFGAGADEGQQNEAMDKKLRFLSVVTKQTNRKMNPEHPRLYPFPRASDLAPYNSTRIDSIPAETKKPKVSFRHGPGSFIAGVIGGGGMEQASLRPHYCTKNRGETK